MSTIDSSFALQVWAVLMELMSAFNQELEALKARDELQLGRSKFAQVSKLVNELREKASARAAQESGTFSDVLLNFSVFKLLGSKRLCRVVSACVFVFFLPVTFWPLLLLDVERACVKALEVVPLQRNFDARRSRDDLAADARAWKRGFVAARAEWRGEYNDAFSAYWSLSADLLGGWGVRIAQLLALVLVVEGCALLLIPWVHTPPPAVEALPARRMKSADLRRSSAARLQDLRTSRSSYCFGF